MNFRDGLFLLIGFGVAVGLALAGVFGTGDETAKQKAAAELEQAKRKEEKTRAALAQATAQQKAVEAQREQDKLAKAQADRKKAAAERDTQRLISAAERAALERIEAARKAAIEELEDAARRQREQLQAPPYGPGSTTGDSLFAEALNLERESRYAEAVRVLTRAARSGSGQAAKLLGDYYDKGRPGVPRDYAESLKWYNTARALGEDIKDARCSSGSHSMEPLQATTGEQLFEQADSLEKEGRCAEAFRTYTRAARTGSGKAANRLGEIYGRGIECVPMNYAESLKWCYTARALGEIPNCAAR